MFLVCLGRETIQVYSCQISGKNKTLFAVEDGLVEGSPPVVLLAAACCCVSCLFELCLIAPSAPWWAQLMAVISAFITPSEGT